jgi:hypothetical protein
VSEHAPIVDADRRFTEAEAAVRLGISKASLMRERVAGRIRPYRFGSRTFRYTEEILDEYRAGLYSDVDVIIHDAFQQKRSLIKEPGIYFLYQGNDIVYVGKTTNFVARLSNHMFNKSFDGYSFIPVAAHNLDSLEIRLIEKLRPPLNILVNPDACTRRRTR